MYPDPRFGHWRNQRLKNSAESIWKIREFLAPVTTRSGRTISGPVQPRFERKREEDPPSDTIKDTTAMAALHEEDPEIGSFNAHLNGEPTSAIVNSTGQAGIEVKTMCWLLCLIFMEGVLIIPTNSSTNSVNSVASKGDPLG
ncbi:linoleate 13S-lipoxygenase 2-1, chloroplastic-like [Salvia divinorum]|uniref:Linoleate 13S-lipoxygenase 2-1, chloroplastic-like n=1 Tax=Salvia divinorum TaxID=28513 RepID=A0ABD1HU69_SALDI